MRLTREELGELWTALQQYVDNHEDEEAPPVPAAALTVLEKLDTFFEAVWS